MRAAPHILVVDDDGETRELLEGFLQRHGYRVAVARDGREMRARLEDRRFHLIVLDLMLPGDDGLALCRELRAKSRVPIVMLTAMGEEVDRIVGLEMGADDYLAKPFNPRELLARIKAVLRRTGDGLDASERADRAVLEFDGWHLDLGARQLRDPDGEPLELTGGEYELLVAFAERPQRVLTRDALLDLTRGRDAAPFDRSIDVQISRLRRKLRRDGDGDGNDIIKTVHRAGYMFATAVSKA